MKDPDILNQILAVLLVFRNGVYAAVEDVIEMYNLVWLEEWEMHLHRFSSGRACRICNHKFNFGDKQAGCMAQTANFPFFAHLKEGTSEWQLHGQHCHVPQ